MKSDGLSSFRWQQLGSTNSGGLPGWRRWGSPRGLPSDTPGLDSIDRNRNDDVSFQGAASPSKASRDTRLDPGGQVNPEPVRVLSTTFCRPNQAKRARCPSSPTPGSTSATASSKVSGKAGWPRSIAPSTTPSARWLPSRKTASSHPRQYDSSTGRPGCWPPSAIRTCRASRITSRSKGRGNIW